MSVFFPEINGPHEDQCMQKPNPPLLITELKFVVPLLFALIQHCASHHHWQKYIYPAEELAPQGRIYWNLPFAGGCQGKVYCSNLNVSSDQNVI